jgi:hypothetical protein
MGSNRTSLRWPGCALAIALAALAPTRVHSQSCADDLFAGTLACSSSDVALYALEATSVVDGCDFIGDTATATLRAQLTLTGALRYDIGIFLALDAGSALAGMCHHDFLPPPLTCASTSVNAISGSGPFFNGECATADVCGEMTPEVPSVLYDLAALSPITVPCVDSDGDGLVDVSGVVSWNGSASNGSSSPHCTGLANAIPGGPTRCSSGTHGVAGLVAQTQTIEVRKELDDADPGDTFSLRIDGVTFAEATQTGDSTGPIPVAPGARAVSEVAGNPETSLSDYESSIACVELVGTCSNDATRECVTNAMCAGGACDLAPVSAWTCNGCTSLAVLVPPDQSRIQCTITNAPEPHRLALASAGACAVGLLARRRRPNTRAR